MSVLATLVFLGITIPTITHSDISEATQIKNNPLDVLTDTSTISQIKQAIEYEAINNGINPNLMLELADCESDFVSKCITDTNQKLSCGIYMFQKTTFKWLCPDLKWSDEYISDNIKCATRLINKGYGSTTVGWYNCWKKHDLNRYYTQNLAPTSDY